MQAFKASSKFATIEAIVYPLLVVALMWTVFLVDRHYQLSLYRYGLKPSSLEGIKGILFMPFIHGQKDFSHIINNSVPIAVLLGALIYFYRSVALYVILFVWFGGGFLLWYLAENTGSYHIGMSGIIYGLFGFLLVSGFIRKYLPLQAISLFVVFIYGSMVWGVFPTEQRISWEGHLFGLIVGVVTGFSFRKKGPTPPKYAYEIERELGIEPPDLERIWMENNALLPPKETEWDNNTGKDDDSLTKTNVTSSSDGSVEIIYTYKKEVPKK